MCTVLRAIISTPCLHWLIKTYLGKHHLLLRQRLTTRSEASCRLLPVGTRIVNCWRLGSGVETEPDFRVRLPSSLSSLPSSLLPVFEIRIYFTREHLRDILLSYLCRYVLVFLSKRMFSALTGSLIMIGNWTGK